MQGEFFLGKGKAALVVLVIFGQARQPQKTVLLSISGI